MAADKTRASSKACVPEGAAMIGHGDTAAARKMAPSGKVRATAHMSAARSMAATHSVTSASCVAPATTTTMLRQCRSCARQNQS